MRPLSCPPLLRGCFLFILLLLLGACASVEKRIEANAVVFNNYPPEVQQNLREGRIELGYDMTMVEIAKGKPTYVNLRQDARGEITVWRYMNYRHYTRSVPVYDVGLRGSRWVNVTETEEFEVLRVDFKDGIVTGIEAAQ